MFSGVPETFIFFINNYTVMGNNQTSVKAMAEQRVEMLRSFLAAIEEEAGDLLY